MAALAGGFVFGFAGIYSREVGLKVMKGINFSQ